MLITTQISKCAVLSIVILTTEVNAEYLFNTIPAASNGNSNNPEGETRDGGALWFMPQVVEPVLHL